MLFEWYFHAARYYYPHLMVYNQQMTMHQMNLDTNNIEKNCSAIAGILDDQHTSSGKTIIRFWASYYERLVQINSLVCCS